MATCSSNVRVRYDDSESEHDFMVDGRNASYERCLSPESFQGHSFPMSISWISLNPKHHHKSSNWVWKCDKCPDPVAEDSQSNTAEHYEPFDRQGHLPLAGVELLSALSFSAQPSSFRSIEQPPTLPPPNALSQPSSITALSGSCPPHYSHQHSPSPFQQPYDSHPSCYYASFRRSNSHSLSPHRLTPRAPQCCSPVLGQGGEITHGRAIEVQDHIEQERMPPRSHSRSCSPIRPPLPPLPTST
jgi:hypothetical protein